MSLSDVSIRGWRSLYIHDFDHSTNFSMLLSLSLCLSVSLSLCLSLPVPTPSVSMSIPSGTLYEGTSQALTCTVTLPETLDTDVTVGVVWRFTETPVVPSARVEISPVSSTRSPFTSTLILSPLSMSDAGQFSCEATADSASQFITTSSLGESLDRAVTVKGMLYSPRCVQPSYIALMRSSAFSSACTSC